MRPYLCPFCKLGYVDILKHVGACAPAVIQLSDAPDMVRMRTEHPDVLVEEALEQVKAAYAKAGRELSLAQLDFLKQNSLRNLRYLRGEGA